VSTVRDTPEGAVYASWQRPALVATVIGLAVCAAGGVLHPAAFFRAYLVGFMLWLGVALGGMALLMISRLTGGAWADQLRPVLESATQTLPLVAALFLPVLIGLHAIYPWPAQDYFGDNPEALKGLQFKIVYLSTPFFVGRAVAYLVIWNVLGLLLVRGLRNLGPTPTLHQLRRLRAVSAVGLGVYGLTVTFAVIDWTMSLDPKWFSTIYGAMLAVGQLLAGMAFAVAVTVLPFTRRPRSEGPHPQVLNDLGNLMLTFTMLWAYMAFSQFLLVWSGNLPEEIVWYLPRLNNGWQWFALAVLVFQFVVPFCLLLSRHNKRQPRYLVTVALIALAMRPVDLFWVIAPSFPPDADWAMWLTYAVVPFAVVGLGGIWLILFLRNLEAAPPAVVRFEEGHAHD
jgi:hypothetical protein